MGGGGVIRAAAKAAGVGVVNTTFRHGIQLTKSSAEKSVMRVHSRTPSSAVAVSGGSAPATPDLTVSADQKLSWEMVDDWEFAGGYEEDVAAIGSSAAVSDGGERMMPRVLFDGVPSMEEAKEATADLKEALDKLYLSSPTSEDTALASRLSLNSFHEETKDCVAYDVKATSVPKPAIQAFKLLSENPAVQNVVASLAADQNIWHAVLSNPAYMEFLDSQTTNEFEEQGSPQSAESSVNTEKYFDESQPKDSGDPFSDFLQNIKSSVVKMVNKATNCFQSLFTSHTAVNDKENPRSNFNPFEKTAGVMGLVLFVIMVVLLKRV